MPLSVRSLSKIAHISPQDSSSQRGRKSSQKSNEALRLNGDNRVRRDKIGARLGELFRKKLEALGLKRERLCFHSFRHTVAEALEAAAVSQTDAARVLGHAIKGETYGTYSSGPGLKRLAAVVEEIAYVGLMLKRAALSRRDFPSITQMARRAK